MNILLFGPQGSGKGTQARLLCEKFGFFYFESGAYLRRIAETNEEVKRAMASGALVPDLEMTSYLTAYFDQKNLYDDIVLDGFPRTLDQYLFLKNWLTDKNVSIDLVLVIEISEAESIRRLSMRRLDPTTGEIYNLITDLPPEGIDQNKLVLRDDDQPDAIKRRLGIYRSRTQDLIEFLKKETKVVTLDGERPVDEIHHEILNVIDKIDNQNNKV